MPSRMTLLVAAGVAALTVLTGCSSPSAPTVTASTTPAPYLTPANDESPKIPEKQITELKLDASTVRYQGAWQGRSAFLAKSTQDPMNTCIVVGLEGGSEPWQSECGRDAFAIALPPFGTFRYNAHGFPNGTNGYTPLSTWLLAANGTPPA
ncbi:MAG TPA: hypothetical protein VNT53_05265 [Pseudolysinimonas sp.]|nr:hypothetical protein [Pseudolysinimonas sp.]